MSCHPATTLRVVGTQIWQDSDYDLRAVHSWLGGPGEIRPLSGEQWIFGHARNYCAQFGTFWIRVSQSAG
jgi:hypothetical protein